MFVWDGLDESEIFRPEILFQSAPAGEVRDRFGGMGWFKGRLRCKGWFNSVIINVITEINYSYTTGLLNA